jgi:5-methylthioribose kinase
MKTTERENTFCQSSTLVLGDLERGDIDAHEAEWKLIDLGWCSAAISNALSDREVEK